MNMVYDCVKNANKKYNILNFNHVSFAINIDVFIDLYSPAVSTVDTSKKRSHVRFSARSVCKRTFKLTIYKNSNC